MREKQYIDVIIHLFIHLLSKTSLVSHMAFIDRVLLFTLLFYSYFHVKNVKKKTHLLFNV